MAVISARVYVSRDEKKCFNCGCRIRAKAQYVSVFGSADFDPPFTSHWCTDCGKRILKGEQLKKLRQ